MAVWDHLRDLPDGSLTKAEVGLIVDELDRLLAWQRAAKRTFGYIAESCDHSAEHGGDLGPEWDEHLRDPGNGGKPLCGPCAAFRALHEVAT